MKERPKRENRDINSTEDDKDKAQEKVKHISTRKLIGPDEDVFIMDAKSIGIISILLEKWGHRFLSLFEITKN